MRKRLIAGVVLALVIVIGVGSVWARDTPARQSRSEACLNPAAGISIKSSLDKRDACSRLLRDRRLSSTARADAFAQRARAQFDLRRPELAAADLGEAIRLRPADPALFALRAESYRRMDRFARADADAQRVVALAADQPASYVLRGRMALDLGRADRALDDAATAIRLASDRADGYLVRGDALVAGGRFDEALAAFDRAIALDPLSGAGYGARAHAQQMRGDLDAALADIRRAIGRQPFVGLWHAYEGDILRYIGDLDGAMKAFNDELVVHPDFGYALVGRALTFERKGDIAAARVDFERALRRSSDIWDNAASARETARARLAALDSGAVVPATIPAPRKAENATSLPTPTIAPPAVVTRPTAEESKAVVPSQGRRVALVIGNSAYRNVPALPNPQKDAAAVAAVLRAIGFDQVTLTIDADRAKMAEALRAFASDAAKSDWALVYYAGHGMEVGGQNYLIPVDAALASDRDAPSQAIALAQIMAAIDGARKLKLVVLDACRDNPFAPAATADVGRHVVAAIGTGVGGASATRSAGRGLGEPTLAGASLVVFAAKHGQVALDGEGGNSPFAMAFAQRIITPGVEIDKIFRLVRDDVLEATAGRQEPYTYGSLPGREEFFFIAARR
ncbi:MAG: caspase family protein [Rhodopseudomonas sp.]|uniref:caspase family protein n=1 Tax=Rhodopseudomonas sp. TaxID=1078 RepID=UPI0039E33164